MIDVATTDAPPFAAPEILECTLRDGSYAIDFQFTPKDTAVIAASLEAAGIRLIEVGHGLGLGAARAGKGDAAAEDEEYMLAASRALAKAAWGMFCIPGIARLDDLQKAADHGMGFVRVGTNATDTAPAEEFIARAKALGMHVSANLMKSYVLPPDELAREAARCADFGADMVCLVDSAGTMLPTTVRDYVLAMRNATPVLLGFHCHDNLHLGVANVLSALEHGVTRVDSTLKGMGRGGGNPATEVLAAVLTRMGVDHGVDLNRLLDLSEAVIGPMMPGVADALDVTAGMAGFHSGFLKAVLTEAERHGVDPRELIVAVCEKDRVDAPPALVEAEARRLAEARARSYSVAPADLPETVFAAPGDGQSLDAAAATLAREVRATASKLRQKSVFNIVAARESGGGAVLSRIVQEEFGCVIASAEVGGEAELVRIVRAVDGVVDILLVDADRRPFMERSLPEALRGAELRSEVLRYSDADTWAQSVVHQLDVTLGGLDERRVAVLGADDLGLRCALALSGRGADVTLWDAGRDAKSHAKAVEALSVSGLGPTACAKAAKAVDGAQALVSFSRGASRIDAPHIAAFSGSLVLDAGLGSVTAEGVSAALERGIPVVRCDMRAAIAARLHAVLGMKDIVTTRQGRLEIDGVSVVAGGVVGAAGDVVVDSAARPARVFGVADGAGRVGPPASDEERERVRRVERALLRVRLNPGAGAQ